MKPVDAEKAEESAYRNQKWKLECLRVRKNISRRKFVNVRVADEVKMKRSDLGLMQVVAILGWAARFDKGDWTCQPRLSIAATNLLLKIK